MLPFCTLITLLKMSQYVLSLILFPAYETLTTNKYICIYTDW